VPDKPAYGTRCNFSDDCNVRLPARGGTERGQTCPAVARSAPAVNPRRRVRRTDASIAGRGAEYPAADGRRVRRTDASIAGPRGTSGRPYYRIGSMTQDLILATMADDRAFEPVPGGNRARCHRIDQAFPRKLSPCGPANSNG
jgi:hypothetical protein